MDQVAMPAAAGPAPYVPAIGPDGRLNRISLRNAAQGAVTRNVRSCAARGLPMVEAGTHAGRTAVIVGTGPSLDRRENRRAIRRLADKGAVVYALKGAATVLRQLGVRVDYVASCDPVPEEVGKMPLLDGPTYLLASCCDPALFDHVLGAGLPVRVYHSATGARVTEHGDEAEFYAGLFPSAWIAAGGMTVANRVLEIAAHHGVVRSYLAGVDFGSRERGRAYAAGTGGALGDGVVWVTDSGAIDGRPWYTQPSLVVSAVAMARAVLAGSAVMIGDSLAGAFAAHPHRMDAAVRGVA